MSKLPLSRIRGPRPIYILAASVAGGAAYRFLSPASASDASLHPDDFSPYTLVDKQPVSSTSAIFTLRSDSGAPEPGSVIEAWKRSAWSVQIKQPQLQIARAYTPLPTGLEGVEDGGPAEDMRLLIRRETGGELSNYLHALPEGATIEMRGPNVEYELPDDVTDVIFLAGGTGVAPGMQIAQALTRRPGSKMHLLWANRRREECEGGISDDAATDGVAQGGSWWKGLFGQRQPNVPQASISEVQDTKSRGALVQELEALKEKSQATTRGLQVQYYVDEEKTFIKPADVAKRLNTGESNGSGSQVIIISGPDGFIDYWAGKKRWIGGHEVQGPLGGVLAKMDLKNWKVFKL